MDTYTSDSDSDEEWFETLDRPHPEPAEDAAPAQEANGHSTGTGSSSDNEPNQLVALWPRQHPLSEPVLSDRQQQPQPSKEYWVRAGFVPKRRIPGRDSKTDQLFPLPRSSGPENQSLAQPRSGAVRRGRPRGALTLKKTTQIIPYGEKADPSTIIASVKSADPAKKDQTIPRPRVAKDACNIDGADPAHSESSDSDQIAEILQFHTHRPISVTNESGERTKSSATQLRVKFANQPEPRWVDIKDLVKLQPEHAWVDYIRGLYVYHPRMRTTIEQMLIDNLDEEAASAIITKELKKKMVQEQVLRKRLLSRKRTTRSLQKTMTTGRPAAAL
jgi:hypothetical protein